MHVEDGGSVSVGRRGVDVAPSSPHFPASNDTVLTGRPEPAPMSAVGRTSRQEIVELVVAWLALTLAVAFLFTDPVQRFPTIDVARFAIVAAVSFVTAGAGFLLHELAHKVVAQRYGYWAEFRADYGMLALAVVSGLAGFLFAAPGAVHIRDRGGGGITERANGLISLAGPATNLGLFAVFAAIYLVAPATGTATSLGGAALATVGRFGMFVNAFLAGFNMLPWGPLDGRKVLAWSTPVFGATLAVAVGLAYASFTLL